MNYLLNQICNKETTTTLTLLYFGNGTEQKFTNFAVSKWIVEQNLTNKDRLRMTLDFSESNRQTVTSLFANGYVILEIKNAIGVQHFVLRGMNKFSLDNFSPLLMDIEAVSVDDFFSQSEKLNFVILPNQRLDDVLIRAWNFFLTQTGSGTIFNLPDNVLPFQFDSFSVNLIFTKKLAINNRTFYEFLNLIMAQFDLAWNWTTVVTDNQWHWQIAVLSLVNAAPKWTLNKNSQIFLIENEEQGYLLESVDYDSQNDNVINAVEVSSLNIVGETTFTEEFLIAIPTNSFFVKQKIAKMVSMRIKHVNETDFVNQNIIPRANLSNDQSINYWVYGDKEIAFTNGTETQPALGIDDRVEVTYLTSKRESVFLDGRTNAAMILSKVEIEKNEITNYAALRQFASFYLDNLGKNNTTLTLTRYVTNWLPNVGDLLKIAPNVLGSALDGATFLLKQINAELQNGFLWKMTFSFAFQQTYLSKTNVYDNRSIVGIDDAPETVTRYLRSNLKLNTFDFPNDATSFQFNGSTGNQITNIRLPFLSNDDEIGDVFNYDITDQGTDFEVVKIWQKQNEFPIVSDLFRQAISANDERMLLFDRFFNLGSAVLATKIPFKADNITNIISSWSLLLTENVLISRANRGNPEGQNSIFCSTLSDGNIFLKYTPPTFFSFNAKGFFYNLHNGFFLESNSHYVLLFSHNFATNLNNEPKLKLIGWWKWTNLPYFDFEGDVFEIIRDPHDRNSLFFLGYGKNGTPKVLYWKKITLAEISNLDGDEIAMESVNLEVLGNFYNFTDSNLTIDFVARNNAIYFLQNGETQTRDEIIMTTDKTVGFYAVTSPLAEQKNWELLKLIWSDSFESNLQLQNVILDWEVFQNGTQESVNLTMNESERNEFGASVSLASKHLSAFLKLDLQFEQGPFPGQFSLNSRLQIWSPNSIGAPVELSFEWRKEITDPAFALGIAGGNTPNLQLRLTYQKTVQVPTGNTLFTIWELTANNALTNWKQFTARRVSNLFLNQRDEITFLIETSAEKKLIRAFENNNKDIIYDLEIAENSILQTFLNAVGVYWTALYFTKVNQEVFLNRLLIVLNAEGQREFFTRLVVPLFLYNLDANDGANQWNIESSLLPYFRFNLAMDNIFRMSKRFFALVFWNNFFVNVLFDSNGVLPAFLTLILNFQFRLNQLSRNKYDLDDGLLLKTNWFKEKDALLPLGYFNCQSLLAKNTITTFFEVPLSSAIDTSFESQRYNVALLYNNSLFFKVGDAGIVFPRLDLFAKNTNEKIRFEYALTFALFANEKLAAFYLKLLREGKNIIWQDSDNVRTTGLGAILITYADGTIKKKIIGKVLKQGNSSDERILELDVGPTTDI